MGKPDDEATELPSATTTKPDQAPTPVEQPEQKPPESGVAAGMVFNRLARAVSLPSISQRIVRLESTGPGMVRATLDLTEEEVALIAGLS